MVNYNKTNEIPKGDIFPLHDRVKHKILDDFEIMKEYNAELRVCTKKVEIKQLIKHFKRAYYKFYQDIHDINKLGKLTPKNQNILRIMYDEQDKITYHNIPVITTLCREVIHILGITKIEMNKDDRPGAARM